MVYISQRVIPPILKVERLDLSISQFTEIIYLVLLKRTALGESNEYNSCNLFFTVFLITWSNKLVISTSSPDVVTLFTKL